MFGREHIDQKTAITSDRCSVIFDTSPVAEAIQMSISYNQSVTRRRSIGGKVAVIYGSQPVGQCTIARMVLANDPGTFFAGPSWSGCQGGSITLTLAGCGDAPGAKYQINGSLVTSFSIQLQSEDLTVVDNVSIDFLELIKMV